MMSSTGSTASKLLVAAIQATVSVLASLLGAWLLSAAFGFRFLPGLVAAVSGACAAAAVLAPGRREPRQLRDEAR